MKKSRRIRRCAANLSQASTRKPRLPTLRFTPDAWGQWLYLRDQGPTEIGAFGLSDPSDPWRVTRLIVPRQYCSEVTVRFDEESLAEEFENLVDSGYTPQQFARIWLHTHPGDSATPSFMDEETFAEKFSDPDWAIMGILARSGTTYARLRWNAFPGFEIELQVEVDYQGEFAGSRFEEWQELYLERVIPETWLPPSPADGFADPWWGETPEGEFYESF